MTPGGLPHGVLDARPEGLVAAVARGLGAGVEELGHQVSTRPGLQAQGVPTAAHLGQRQLPERGEDGQGRRG